MIHLFWQTELSLGQPGSLSNFWRHFFIFCQCLLLHIWHTISRTIWSDDSDGFCARMNKYCIYDKLRQIVFFKSLTTQTFSRKYMVRKYLKRKFMVQIISSAVPSVTLKYLLGKIQQTVTIFSKWWLKTKESAAEQKTVLSMKIGLNRLFQERKTK